MPHRPPSAVSLWRCPRCTLSKPRKPTTLRPFSTTLPQPQETTSQPSPESPRFMPSPPSKQANYTPPTRIRGTLPVPRNILALRKRGTYRQKDYGGNGELYLKRIAPLPAKPPPTRANEYPGNREQAERSAFRARLANMRRKHLRGGVVQLRERRDTRRDLVVKQKEERMRAQIQREEEFDARMDEKLTRPTVPGNMRGSVTRRREGQVKRYIAQSRGRLQLKFRRETSEGEILKSRGQKIPDPNREQRVAEMRARFEAGEARKRADRQDALHTLYMNARSFITNEEQLDEALDKAFGTEKMPRDFNRGVSVWDLSSGNPFQGIQDKMRGTGKGPGRVGDSSGFAAETNRRLKRIAEELTGGKM